MPLHWKPKHARVGFTLIEILVVIAIIGVLASLVAYGVTRVIVSQRLSNTRGVIAAVDKTLKQHWAFVIQEASKETGLSGPFAAIDNVFGPDLTGTGERNRIIWIKMRLMEAFPETYGEILNPFPYNFPTANNPIIPPALRKYNGTYRDALGHALGGARKFDNFAKDPNLGPPGVTESSACLFMALSVSRNGTALTVDSIGASNIADSPNRALGDAGDGLKEIVDGWGNPLSFFRFPTHCDKLQQTNPAAWNPAAPVYADPVDPGGVLFNWKGPGRANFRKYVHTIAYTGSNGNKNAACYVIPTIVSWGPTGDINAAGFPPTAVPTLSPIDNKPYVGRQLPWYSLGLDRNIANYMGIAADPGSAHEEADNVYSFAIQ